MANRKEKLELGTFGDAPTFTASIPSIKGLDSDIAVAAAIGRIGGGIKRVWCSTLFHFGTLAKKKGEKYNPSKAWDAYYAEMYAAAPMQPGSKRTAKKEDTVWAGLAQVKKWDTQEIAGRIFDHPHGSFSQRCAAARKVMENHADEAPDEDELEAILPKPKKKGEETATTIKAWANGKKKAFVDIQANEALWDQIESNAELLRRFHAANTAVTQFAAMAATITDKVKKNEKAAAEGTVNKAQLAAALKKNKPAKGAQLDS
jgi:hypothetical protein